MIPIEYSQDKRKSAIYAFISLGFSSMGLILISSNKPDSIMPYAVTVFFGFIGVWGIKNLLKPDPYLTLNDDGIDSSMLDIGILPWSDIIDARIKITNGHASISLKMKNASEYISRLNIIAQLSYKVNFVFGFKDFALPLAYVKARPSDVLSDILEQIHSRNNYNDEDL